MATPTIVPVGYENNYKDFLKAPVDRSGAVRSVAGTVTVPNTTAEGALIGLVPFVKGARFIVDSRSIHITDIDAGTDSVMDIGVIYQSAGEGTDDVDAFVSASTVGRTGGFFDVDETAGMTLVTTGNGWLAVRNTTNVTEAEGTITFRVEVVYDN
jgi:hypothetical protein